MSQYNASSVRMNASGSRMPGEPAFLAVGKLRRSHGVKGEILMEVFTDFPERLIPGMTLYLDSDRDPLRLIKCRPHNQGLLMSFEGYTTPEQISQYRNQILYVKSDDRPPLADGEYYHHQLIGLRVTSEAGLPIGAVVEILETGASDVLVVRPEAGIEVLIPFVDEFIQDIDLAKAEIIVHLIPGMLGEGT